MNKFTKQIQNKISHNKWLITVLFLYFVLQLIFALNADYVSGGPDAKKLLPRV